MSTHHITHSARSAFIGSVRAPWWRCISGEAWGLIATTAALCALVLFWFGR